MILHSRADDVVPFADSEELGRNSGLQASALIEVGSDHRLADPEPLKRMLEACEAGSSKQTAEPGPAAEEEQITVCIGQFAHTSVDGGKTWRKSLREIPAKNMPTIQGKLAPLRLPALQGRGAWDFATVLDSGVGAVAAHEFVEHPTNDKQSRLCVFLTDNGGDSWRRLEVAELFGANFAREKAWGAERADALVMPNETFIAVAWREPRLFDGERSHVICSPDGGRTWKHSDLGEHNPQLAHDPDGRLLSLNAGYFLVSLDGGENWKKETFQVEWPATYQERKVCLLRHVQFVDRQRALALIVHWAGNGNMDASGIGLVVSSDQGRSWQHVCTLPGPNYGDVNARHTLSLTTGRRAGGPLALSTAQQSGF